MRETFRGALLVAALAFIPAAVGAEEGAVGECPEGQVCETLVVKGEPYTFPTSWLYSPGGAGYGVFGGGSGMDSVAAGLANLPSPYEMLLLKESARKAGCRGIQEKVLQLTLGRGFFQALQRYAKEAGKKFIKGGLYWSGVLLTTEVLHYYYECPDFWGGTTHPHTEGIG